MNQDIDEIQAAHQRLVEERKPQAKPAPTPVTEPVAEVEEAPAPPAEPPPLTRAQQAQAYIDAEPLQMSMSELASLPMDRYIRARQLLQSGDLVLKPDDVPHPEEIERAKAEAIEEEAQLAELEATMPSAHRREAWNLMSAARSVPATEVAREAELEHLSKLDMKSYAAYVAERDKNKDQDLSRW